jgi:hypothetical protein
MWRYLSNQLSVVTVDNYKKGLIINNYHDAALEKIKNAHPTDTVLAMLYQRYHPLSEIVVDEYQVWKGMGGIKMGSTLNLDQLLATTSSKLNIWEPAIMGKFVKTSSEYKTIFPNGRLGLTRGSKDTRVGAIKTLAQSLAGIADLATTKAAIDVFYGEIKAARSNQLGSKSAVGQGSSAIGIAVANAMEMQYRNLGLLIDKYYATPQMIESLFDVATLQEGNQTSFTGTLDPSENEAILIHTFLPTDELRLKIIGNAAARFFLSNNPNGINSEPVQVLANSQVITPVTEFSVTDYATYRYLTVVNQSNSVTTKYEVEVL